MLKLYIGIGAAVLIIGIAIGITGTLIVQKCDVTEAMKPLVYVVNELAGRSCR